MALSAQLGNANLTAESISTSATLTMEKLDAGWTITAVQLDVVARVPKADAAAFNKAAENAKSGCPVSKVLKADITMNARLEGYEQVSVERARNAWLSFVRTYQASS